MTAMKVTRAAIGAGLLLAAGLAMPAQGQAETKTVQERVVVTLPNGKRIVRMVEKQVPVESASPAGGTTTDPFAAVRTATGETSSDFGTGGNTSNAAASIDPRILQWLAWFEARDMRADANGDGRVTGSDFNAFLMGLNDQIDRDDSTDGDSGGGADGGGSSGGDDTTTGGGDDTDDNTGDGGSDGGDDSDSNLDDGWTQLTPSSDSRVIYVAENGSDNNDGLSPERPLRSVSAGVRKLRDGYPDWLMLRRGDTWSESISTDWEKSGRSETEPMVVTAYGEGPRPRLLTGTSSALQMINREERAHLAFTSMHFEPGVRHEKMGVRIVAANVSDVLIEDCLIEGYVSAVTFQGFEGRLSNMRLRRNIIIDSAGSTHSQGLYGSQTDGLLVEENVFDRNGWDPSRGRDATAGIFAHNVYIQRNNTGVVFRGNWSMRAAAEGMKSRSGGDIDENVLWQNPIQMSYGNDGTNEDDRAVTGSINDNVVLESIHINNDDRMRRGWGIRIEHTREVEVLRNIVANARVDTGFGIAVRSERDAGVCDNLLISENIIDDHGDGIEIDRDLVVDVDVLSNISTAASGDEPLVRLKGDNDMSGLRIEGNLYSHSSLGEPFRTSSSTLTLNEWQASFDPAGGPALSPFQNEDVTMEDFARSIGLRNTDELISALRSQRKGAWDPDLNAENARAYFRAAFTTR